VKRERLQSQPNDPRTSRRRLGIGLLLTTTAGGQVAGGAQLFSNNCESFHGQLGASGHVGPNLQKSPVAGHLALVEKQVRNGGRAMPPFSQIAPKA
jgi:mono/diheme cytochrome c family protein